MSDLLGSALALVEQGASTQEPDFYDAAMTGEGEPAMLPLEQSPWLPMYREAARWIPSSADVVDLGCGTGRFASALLETSFEGSFLGLDFSPAAIAEARDYVGEHGGVTFEMADLRSWAPGPGSHRGVVFTCLEVLEHLEDDLRLVGEIPACQQFVFSVPSYMSASHVRAFPELGSVFERYGGLLELRRWALIDFGDGNLIHVCDSVRRPGGW